MPIGAHEVVCKQAPAVCRLLTLTRAQPLQSHGQPQPGQTSIQQQADSVQNHHPEIGPSEDCSLIDGVDVASVHNEAASAVVASAASQLETWPCMQGIEFLHNLRNPSGLQPALLPMQLKLFARTPVVVSARLFGQTGKPSETFAHLLVK